MSTYTTTPRADLGRQLFLVTLLERLNALPVWQRRALSDAAERARLDAPTDVTLVELAALIATAERCQIDA